MKKPLFLTIFLTIVLSAYFCFAGSVKDYPEETSPAKTDQVLVIKNPDGTWSTVRVPISSILPLIEESDIPSTISRDTEVVQAFTVHEATYNHGDIATSLQTDGNSQIAGLSDFDGSVDDTYYMLLENPTTGPLGRATLSAILSLVESGGGFVTGTIEDLGYSTTPTVVHRHKYKCSTNWDGQSPITIEDFIYSGDAPPQDGDFFGILYDADETTTKFNNNVSAIKGNSGVNFTGSDSQHIFEIFYAAGGIWHSTVLNGGWVNPTTQAFSAIASRTLQSSELYDDGAVTPATPFVLLASELQTSYISNAEETGAAEYDFPAQAEGWDFCFVKEADYDVALDPNGTEQWYFRTSNAPYSQLSAGEAIVNTTSGKSTICAYSTEDGVYFTGDVNWAEETP